MKIKFILIPVLIPIGVVAFFFALFRLDVFLPSDARAFNWHLLAANWRGKETVSLSEITPFPWDTVCFAVGYAKAEKLDAVKNYRVIGQGIEDDSGMNFIFLNDSNRTAHIITSTHFSFHRVLAKEGMYSRCQKAPVEIQFVDEPIIYRNKEIKYRSLIVKAGEKKYLSLVIQSGD
jgi:hypothetical protein